MGVKKRVRKGTSFIAFDEVFPDSQACLEHLFKSRFGPQTSCPKCGKEARFKQVPGTFRFNSHCCFGASRNPRSGTVFARTSLPLIVWYRCILYLVNASNGITISFVRKHFGISHKAAFRMLQLLREHLTRIERTRVLGASGGPVFIDEILLRNVIVKGGKKGIPHRLLVLTDGARFVAVPIQRGKFAKSAKYLAEWLTDNCSIEIRRAGTLRKLLDFRASARLKGRSIYLSSNPERHEYHLLSVFVVKLKMFILKSHLWVSSSNLDGYLGHFMFLYNRRGHGDETFWEAIGCHPPSP